MQTETPWQSDLDHLNWLSLAKLDNFSGKQILDLGCGSGYVCQKAMEQGAQRVVGIDIIKPKLAESGKFDFQIANLDASDWHESIQGDFDLIFAFDILEHLASPFWFLSSCHQKLKANGILVLTTPNCLSWERFYKPNNWSGVQDPQHKTLFTKYSLKFMLEKSGFNQNSIKAPMRALGFLGPLQPQIGGQILVKASR